MKFTYGPHEYIIKIVDKQSYKGAFLEKEKTILLSEHIFTDEHISIKDTLKHELAHLVYSVEYPFIGKKIPKYLSAGDLVSEVIAVFTTEYSKKVNNLTNYLFSRVLEMGKKHLYHKEL